MEKVTHCSLYNTVSEQTESFSVEHAQRILEFEASPAFTGTKGWQLKDDNFEQVGSEIIRKAGKGKNQKPESGQGA